MDHHNRSKVTAPNGEFTGARKPFGRLIDRRNQDQTERFQASGATYYERAPLIMLRLEDSDLVSNIKRSA